MERKFGKIVCMMYCIGKAREERKKSIGRTGEGWKKSEGNKREKREEKRGRRKYESQK